MATKFKRATDTGVSLTIFEYAVTALLVKCTYRRHVSAIAMRIASLFKKEEFDCGWNRLGWQSCCYMVE